MNKKEKGQLTSIKNKLMILKHFNEEKCNLLNKRIINNELKN